MKPGSSFSGWFMFIHIQINVFPSTTSQSHPSAAHIGAGWQMWKSRHAFSSSCFPTSERAVNGRWKKKLRLFAHLIFSRSSQTQSVSSYHYKIQEAPKDDLSGFIHTIRVAKASRASEILQNIYTVSRQKCLQTQDEILARLMAKLPFTSKESGFHSLEVMYFCDVLSILNWHQVNSLRKEVAQSL